MVGMGKSDTARAANDKTVAQDLSFIKKLQIGMCIIIPLAVATFGVVSWRSDAWDKYHSCVRGNEFRAATRQGIVDHVRYIDNLLAALTGPTPDPSKFTPDQQQRAADFLKAHQAELDRAKQPAFADRVCSKP